MILDLITSLRATAVQNPRVNAPSRRRLGPPHFQKLSQGSVSAVSTPTFANVNPHCTAFSDIYTFLAFFNFLNSKNIVNNAGNMS